MKKNVLIAALLATGIISAQHIAPKHEAVNGMVKSTYYYDNGQVSQQGFYKDGKLEGKWTSFDEQGNKKAIAEYSKGMKTGKWFFWNDNNLSEVDYSNSRIASVKNWKQDALAKRN